MKLFKGYRPLRNKKPISKGVFKKCADLWQEVGGVLNQGVCLVDIDDKSHNADIVLGLLSLESIDAPIVESKRGYHIFFAVPRGLRLGGSHRETLCGAIVDYKKEGDYERFRVDGEDLHKLYVTDCQLPELPFYLYPLSKKMDLQATVAGCRHHNLLNVSNIMAKYCNDSSRIRMVLEYINNFVFEEPRDGINIPCEHIDKQIEWQANNSNILDIVKDTLHDDNFTKELQILLDKYNVKS